MEYKFLWSSPSAGAPMVTIAEYGITFNATVIDLMKNPERVLIGYDEINKVIGVKPVGDDYEHNRSYPFKNRELKGYVRIGNREFLKYIAIKAGIDISKAKKYIAEWNEEQGLLIIDLKQSTNETEEIK